MKKILLIILAILVVLIIVSWIWYAVIDHKAENKVCTMEMKQCPDSSYVGRTGPNCKFAECPELLRNCVDKCGDGTCQEIVCSAVGCPCAETKITCPQDCEQ